MELSVPEGGISGNVKDEKIGVCALRIVNRKMFVAEPVGLEAVQK